ncbi:glycosyltransferase [Nocardioides sp. R1-1]|uniref:glycosyltransferase n=1 Tax=Nocardioides sp. R1-1 TaxID=3383502 RepID=UPI0038D02499
MGTQAPVRVLHVIESYGSGSLTAAVQYVRSSPELEHHLLRRVREDYVPFGEEALFASIAELPASRVRSVGTVRARVRALAPDVVHAHSSFAGLFTRLAVRAGRSARVVYTPHCFVFERTDLPSPVRRLYRLVEWLLAANTSVVAGCSPGEAHTARRWRTCRAALHLPHVVEPAPPATTGPPAEGPPVVVSLGRVSPQKDPGFLVATVDELRQRTAQDVRALWIGGGEAAAVARLEEAGVRVTGWVSRDRVPELLSSAHLYLHTAAWEGFPMSVVEAHQAGLPIVVRDIAPFRHLPTTVRAREPRELAALARRTLEGDGAATNRSLWERALAGHTVAAQRARLLEAYDLG